MQFNPSLVSCASCLIILEIDIVLTAAPYEAKRLIQFNPSLVSCALFPIILEIDSAVTDIASTFVALSERNETKSIGHDNIGSNTLCCIG